MDWILNHDDSKFFFIIYIGLSVVLSIFFGLFWLLAVVLVHLVLDIFVNAHSGKELKESILLGLWELKLDFSLVLFALSLAVYMDVIFGVLGIGQGFRLAAQIGSRAARGSSNVANMVSRSARIGVRFAGWQRLIRPILLSVDDGVQVLRTVINGTNADKNILEQVQDIKEKAITVSQGDRFVLGFTAIILFSIVVSPLILEYSGKEVITKILVELKPF